MPPTPSGFTGTVAELFAALGLDSSQFDRGLKQAEVNLVNTAQLMTAPIKGIQTLLSQLAVQVGPEAAVAGMRQLRAETEKTRAALLDLDKTLGIQAFNLARTGVAAQSLQGVIGTSGSSPADFRGFGQQSGGGGMGIVGRVATRIALYGAAYGAARFVGSALERPIDIQRQQEQTGFSAEGVQRLQYAATATNTPIETLSASINRLQSHIEELATASGPAAEKAARLFKELNIGYSEFRAQLEQNPEAAVNRLVQAIGTLDSAAKRAEAFKELFGGRGGGRQEEALRVFSENAHRSTVLIDEQVSVIARLAAGWNVAWMKAKDYFDLILLQAVPNITPSGPSQAGSNRAATEAFKRRLGIPEGLNALPTSPPLLGQSFGLGPLGGGPSFETGPSGVAAFERTEAINKELTRQNSVRLEQMQRYAELRRSLGPEEERQEEALAQQLAQANELYREQFISLQQLQALRQGAQAKADEQQQKKALAELHELSSILSRFGADGKINAQLVAVEFNKVTEAFRQGRITIEELKEAAAGYFAMMEEEAARPSIREAIKMFEQGFLSDRDLVNALRRKQAFEGRAGVENLFMQGEADPADLRRAQILYRQQLFQYRNNATPPLPTPGEVISRRLAGPQASSEFGGTINVVALDQFSESMLRRWKQQGLLTS